MHYRFHSGRFFSRSYLPGTNSLHSPACALRPPRLVCIEALRRVFRNVRTPELRTVLAVLIASLLLDAVIINALSNLYADPLTSRARVLPSTRGELSALYAHDAHGALPRGVTLGEECRLHTASLILIPLFRSGICQRCCRLNYQHRRQQ